MIKWVTKKSLMWTNEMKTGVWEGMHINKGKDTARIELRIIYDYFDVYATSGLQSRMRPSQLGTCTSQERLCRRGTCLATCSI